MSAEHDISVVSAISILNNINKQKYKIYPIYIDKNGIWNIFLENKRQVELGDSVKSVEKINNVVEYLKNLDIVFPVLHGTYGEDGAIQGMLKMLNIPYVGCGILASSLGMDKIYSKIIFEKARTNANKILLHKKTNRYLHLCRFSYE